MFVLSLCRGRLSIALLMLGLGLSTTAYAADFPSLELPDSMRVEIVAMDMRVDGVKTRIYAFHSNDGPDTLARYFDDFWDGRMARAQGGGWDVLSHRAGGYLITIQMQPSATGSTQGYIAFADIFDAADSGRKPPKPGVPLLPGTEVHQDMRATDQGRESQTLILTSRQSVSQNLDFYRAYFAREGYEPVAANALAKGDSDGVMILNRGAEQVNLVATESAGRTVITIVKVKK